MFQKNTNIELSGFYGLLDKTGNQKNVSHLCILCKAGKLLCGKSRCPLLVKFYTKQNIWNDVPKTEIDGSSPPGVFIGRYGYPDVYIGPLIPSIYGDTSIFDLPELWTEKKIDDIAYYRLSLVRGMKRVNIFDVYSMDKIVETTIEFALGKESVDAEAKFSKPVKYDLLLDDDSQPFGPHAPIEKIKIGNVKYDEKLEKAYYDTDLLARDAVLELYQKGVYVSKIQRAFSVGAFGLKKNRRFVPTRWSITAVDSLLGLHLMNYTKTFPLINEYRVYERVSLDNRWLVLFFPTPFEYELVEAWYPNTIWNPYGQDIMIISSYESNKGRTKYAEIGGCYYAARLAVNELMNKERRQAGCVILRESHPGYIFPVGVWNVRENVREALRNAPHKFETLNEVLEFIKSKMAIPLRKWIKHSRVLQNNMYQKTLDNF